MSSHIGAPRASGSLPGRQSPIPAGRSAAAAPAPAAGGGFVDVPENALDVGVVGAAALVEAHAAVAAVEEGRADVLFQHADAVGDGGGGDAELPGGAHEALVAGGGVEEAEAVEGREVGHGAGAVYAIHTWPSNKFTFLLIAARRPVLRTARYRIGRVLTKYTLLDEQIIVVYQYVDKPLD